MAVTADTDIPRTLKRARKAAGFSNAKAFLAAVKEAEGAAPSYSTYAQWESGEVEPRDETLAPVRRFHEARQTWTPEESAPDLAAALVMLTQELRAAREERAAMRDRLDELEAMVQVLVPAADDAAGTAAAATPRARKAAAE